MANEARTTEERSAGAGGEGFERYTASLIVVAGGSTGEEHIVESPRWLLGRGPEVDVAFSDPEMSQRHLRIEFSRGRFHAIDLDSTNGTFVNGTTVASAELAHGDRLQAGGHVFQILIERNETRTRERWSARGDVLPRVQ
jgi:pSer/pThr/pTyr-binding forkhead associated (FHA) protein